MHSDKTTVNPPNHANPLPKLFSPSSFKDAASICASTSSWYPYYQAGMQAMKRGKYLSAVDSFSNVSDPTISQRDSSYYPPGQAAREGYQNPCMLVQASRPQFTAMICYRRAYALYKLEEFDDALSDINLAIRATARIKELDMHHLATDIRLAMGEYEEAVKVYQAGLVAVKGRVASKKRLTKEEDDTVARLQQLVPKPHVDLGKRIDPFEVLPLEIIEVIMQHGINANDEYYALKCSWISKNWRTTIHNMSSLWRVYTYNPGAKQTTLEKRNAWARLAGNRFNEIRLVDVDSVTAMKKINNSWKPYLKDLQTLTLGGTTCCRGAPIEQFALAHSASYTVEKLKIEPAIVQTTTSDEMDLGLLTDLNRTELEELSVNRIHFYYNILGNDATIKVASSEYTSLRKLSVRSCYLLLDAQLPPPVVGHRPQYDPLHRLLRRSGNLEVLQFSSAYPTYRHFTTFDRPLIELEHLHTLRIPPPSLWTIDIKTPRVRHLAFDLMQSVERTRHTVLEKAATCNRGLIPDLESFAVTGIDLGKLITVELLINGSDTKERMHGWLDGMKNVEKLVIRSPKLSSGTLSQLSPYYSPNESKLEEVQMGPEPASTANRSLVTLLQEDPRLCPKLKELHLTNMYTPENSLLAWLQDRKHCDGAADIHTLSLVHCTFISSAANRQLDREVPRYSNIEHGGISRLGWKELCENWDKDVKNPDNGLSLSQVCEAVPSPSHLDSKVETDK